MRRCPNCHSDCVIKNGSIHNGKQKYACKDCGRQFVDDPHYRVISDETKALIERMLLKKIPLAGNARVVRVSERWLQTYVNETYGSVSRKLSPQPKKKGCLTIERDGLWSFVGHKGDKQWVW